MKKPGAHANQLARALAEVGAATKRPGPPATPEGLLANAVPYMQAFGHTVLAWIWLDVALAVLAKDNDLASAAHRGAWRRSATSSTTSCPRSVPGCRWSRRAMT
jgi:butyryl-CoA dehydrogenase